MTAQTGFAAWAEKNNLDTPQRVYDYFYYQIQAAAQTVGIALDFNDIDPTRGAKYSRLKATDKNHKGKVVAFVNIQDKQGLKLPFFRFYTNAHGGVDETFSTYSALWNLYSQHAQINHNHRPAPVVAAKPVKNYEAEEVRTNLWKTQQVTLWEEAHNKGGDYLVAHIYLQQKFAEHATEVAVIAKNSGVKFGNDKKGHFLSIQYINRAAKPAGYQRIYDQAIDDTGRNKDYRFLPNAKNGSFAVIGASRKKDDYVYLVEGYATGLSVHLVMDKTVFVAGDANNLVHVLEVLTALGYKRIIIGADNDINPIGNAGVFSALQAAKKFKARIFVAQLDGKKADFNDVLLAKGKDALKRQLVTRSNPVEIEPNKDGFEYQLQLLAVAPKNSLKKYLWLCCREAVNNLLKLDFDSAKAQISTVLTDRNESDLIKLVDKTLEKTLEKALNKTKFRNTIDLPSQFDCLDCTDLTNQQIAKHVFELDGIVLDNRPMGYRKTELMGEVLALAKAKGITTSYICHRQSLVASSSERINSVSYKKLKNTEAVLNEVSVALCINSIINQKYQEHVVSFSEIIFIDEIRQTLEHIAIGSIHANERKPVHDALIAAIKNARLIIGSDADLNQMTVDWLKHHFPEKSFFGLTCQANKPKAAVEYGGFLPVFNDAVKTVLDGVKTLIQCDSINTAKAVYQALKRPHLKVLLIHSENKADKEQAAFLLNTNAEIVKYDAVIHSPVIGSGVSIVCDHIQAHYMLLRGVLSENEILQMLGRNRPSSRVVIGFNDVHNKNRVNSAKTLFEGESIARARVVSGDLMIDSVDRLRMKVLAVHNDSLNDYAVQTLLLLRVKGYSLSRFGSVDESEETLLEAREQAKNVHCEGVLSANDIDHVTAYKHEKAESLTQEQSYEFEKYRIKTEFAKKEIDSDDVEFFDGGRVVKVIDNREIANATPDQRAAHDIEQGLNSKANSKGLHIDIVLSQIKGLLGKGHFMDQKLAVAICTYLSSQHKELAACGLGNYQKISKYPIRQLNEFLERFGFSLVAHKISTGTRKGERVYDLVSDARIDAIVSRRTDQNPFFSGSMVADGA